MWRPEYVIKQREVPLLEPGIVQYNLDFETPLLQTQFVRLEDESPGYDGPSPDLPALLSKDVNVNPFDWSPAQKNLHVAFSCISVATASFAASSYSPAVDQIRAEWNVGRVAATCGILAFTTGWAIAPMLLAPFSELMGRRPVVLGSGSMLLVCTICCGFTRHFLGLISARFFAGVGSSTFAMGNGLITDIYRIAYRNTPMSIFAGAAVFGIGLGPLLSGFFVEYTTWRWIFYSQAIVQVVIITAKTFFYRETRSNVLLRRKAELLNKWHEEQEAQGFFVLAPPNEKQPRNVARRVRWKPNIRKDETKADFLTMLKSSAVLPLKMLFTDEVLFFFSLWAAFSWSVLYLCLSAVALMFKDQYSFSVSQSNAVFASECIGAILAALLGIYQCRIGRIFWLQTDEPESRLYFARAEVTLLPLGLLMFGWAGETETHWTLPTVAIGVSTVGITMVYIAVFNYFSDTYGTHASSAIAAQNLVRNGMCGFFPLVATQIFEVLGYGRACSIFAAIGAVLSILPWVLKRYGPQIRRRSRFAESPRDSVGSSAPLNAQMALGQVQDC